MQKRRGSNFAILILYYQQRFCPQPRFTTLLIKSRPWNFAHPCVRPLSGDSPLLLAEQGSTIAQNPIGVALGVVALEEPPQLSLSGRPVLHLLNPLAPSLVLLEGNPQPVPQVLDESPLILCLAFTTFAQYSNSREETTISLFIHYLLEYLILSHPGGKIEGLDDQSLHEKCNTMLSWLLPKSQLCLYEEYSSKKCKKANLAGCIADESPVLSM